MKVIQRGNSYRVAWRLGGTRDGAPQSYSADDLDKAEEALALVMRRKKKITKNEVYTQIDGVDMAALAAASKPAAEEAPPEPTVAEWSEEYFRRKTKLSPSQRGKYKAQLRLEILPSLGSRRLSEVTEAHIADLVNGLLGCDCVDGVKGPRCSRAKNGRHGFDHQTVDRYYSLTYSIFKSAVKAGKITVNPCDNTDWSRNGLAHDDADEEDADHVYLTEAEFIRIRSFLHEDALPFVDYLMGTGARFSEATAAAVSSVDPSAQPFPVIKIHRAWKKRPPEERTPDKPEVEYLGTTKGRARRTLEIDEQLLQTLKPLIAGQPEDAFVFRAPRGGHIIHSNFVNRRWNPAIIAAMRCEEHPPLPEGKPTKAEDLAGPKCGDNGGVRMNNAMRATNKPCGAKVVPGTNRCKDHGGVPKHAVSTCGCPHVLKQRPTPHDLRHTHATWLLDDGEALHAVSERLGHRSQEVTERIYKGKLPKARASMVQSISQRMRRVRGVAA